MKCGAHNDAKAAAAAESPSRTHLYFRLPPSSSSRAETTLRPRKMLFSLLKCAVHLALQAVDNQVQRVHAPQIQRNSDELVVLWQDDDGRLPAND
jgi:hypothetical protein